MKSALQLIGVLGIILAILMGAGILQIQLGISNPDGDHLIAQPVLTTIAAVIGVAALTGSFFVDREERR